MKKSILALIAISATFFVQAQNIGVGTNTPTEKLDVNGNVNVQGNLKVNGNAGQPGQVLRVNNDGSQSWANTFGYKNRKIIYVSSNWTVPAGVKEIMIEALGGGGGGAKGGGGGGGGYAIGIYKVAPGSVISITTGSGGTGSTTEGGFGNPGSDFFASLSSQINIRGTGGIGANSAQPGTGGSYVMAGDSLVFSLGIAGVAGGSTIESYSQLNATSYVTMRKYGNGGGSGFAPHNFAAGSFLTFNTVTLLNVSLYYGAYSAEVGMGGAGGNAPGGNWGFDGLGGFVAISW